MRKKLSREELVNIRKRELEKKELEFQIGRDLRLEYDKRENAEQLLKGKNPWIIAAINFFGTMFFGYVVFLFLKFGLKKFLFLLPSMLVDTMLIDTFFTAFHILIWVISIVAVIRKRSPLDNLLNRF